jgi:hypothetical protein
VANSISSHAQSLTRVRSSQLADGRASNVRRSRADHDHEPRRAVLLASAARQPSTSLPYRHVPPSRLCTTASCRAAFSPGQGKRTMLGSATSYALASYRDHHVRRRRGRCASGALYREAQAALSRMSDLFSPEARRAAPLPPAPTRHDPDSGSPASHHRIEASTEPTRVVARISVLDEVELPDPGYPVPPALS